MFKRIHSIYHTRLFTDFNSSREKHYEVAINGAQPFEENLWIEPMSVINLTEQGGYVGCCFADLCLGEVKDFGVGVYLDAEGDILYNGEKLQESLRIPVQDGDELIICGKDVSALFYPLVQPGFEIYMDYRGDSNSIGYVSVKKGISKPKMRNVMKYGFHFSVCGEFFKEDSELNLFNECSFLTMWTPQETCI